MQSSNAVHHAYHEETFTILNPGLTAPSATARFIHCLDTQPAGLYCEDRPDADRNGIQFDKSTIVFEMKASLRHEPNFYLTTRGDRDEPGFEAEASARMRTSCWLGPPADKGLERAVYTQGLRRLQAIGRETGAITSQVAQAEPGKGALTTDLDLLQICWSPSDIFKATVKGTCANPMSYMPVYDIEGNQCSFRTLEEVPFGARVRVRFTLQSGRPVDGGDSKPEIMTARLLSMHIL